MAEPDSGRRPPGGSSVSGASADPALGAWLSRGFLLFAFAETPAFVGLALSASGANDAIVYALVAVSAIAIVALLVRSTRWPGHDAPTTAGLVAGPGSRRATPQPARTLQLFTLIGLVVCVLVAVAAATGFFDGTY